MRMNHGIASVAAALLMASIGIATARGEVRVSGSEDNIVLHAKNATLSEILLGVQSALHINITLMGSTTRQYTGLYEGPPRRVLSRLLDGVNYIVSSRPDGMIVSIIGPSTPRSGPIVAAAPTAIDAAAPAAIKIAADDSDGSANPGGQGWVPTEDPYKAFRPAAPKTVAPGVTVDQAQPVRVEVDEQENNSGAQGWTPTEDPYKAFRPAAPKTAAPGAGIDPTQPVRVEVDEPENNSGAQGWTPTEDPYKAFRSAATAAQPAAKAAPRIPDFSALGSVNALMNDMEDNPTPQGSNGPTDLPNRQLRSSKVPPSLAPMPTPPPGLDY